MPDLKGFIRQELTKTPLPIVTEVAKALSARHNNAVQTALFYGSCLRDGVFEDRILDFYLLVDSYRNAHGSPVSAFFNTILPPNVYYAETHIDGEIYRSKYAVLTVHQFARMCSKSSFSPYIWARFSQPAQLISLDDGASTEAVAAATAAAVRTMLLTTTPLLFGPLTSESAWTAAFNATYRTELRAEGVNKGSEIYQKNKAFYDTLSPLAFQELGISANESASTGAAVSWFFRRLQGKILSVLKLAKATFTFANGVDYILWKVERHSGVHVEPTKWQRKHPLLSSVSLSWKLWRQKGFR